MRSLVFALMIFRATDMVFAGQLRNCPMQNVRRFIEVALRGDDEVPPPVSPNYVMTRVRAALEDVYGGTWGVLIIRNPELVSTEVHWTIPDKKNGDGTPAFCLDVVNGWQFNIFKTDNIDSPNRQTVEQVVNELRGQEGRGKVEPIRVFSVREFDNVLRQSRIRGA